MRHLLPAGLHEFFFVFSPRWWREGTIGIRFANLIAATPSDADLRECYARRNADFLAVRARAARKARARAARQALWEVRGCAATRA
jgi:hypothetical protein